LKILLQKSFLKSIHNHSKQQETNPIYLIIIIFLQ
jgi:hypothetical protein